MKVMIMFVVFSLLTIATLSYADDCDDTPNPTFGCIPYVECMPCPDTDGWCYVGKYKIIKGRGK